MPDSLIFYEQCIEPLVEAIISKQTGERLVNEGKLCLAKLSERIKQLTSKDLIHPNLAIPKQYPWPNRSTSSDEDQQFPFSSQITKHKDKICQYRNFTILSILFQSSFLDMLIAIACKHYSLFNPTVSFL